MSNGNPGSMSGDGCFLSIADRESQAAINSDARKEPSPPSTSQENEALFHLRRVRSAAKAYYGTHHESPLKQERLIESKRFEAEADAYLKRVDSTQEELAL